MKPLITIIKYTQLTIGICFLLSGLIWCFFILKGYSLMGHLPVFGDPEVISFSGLDRYLIFFTLDVVFFGFCILTLITLICILFRLKFLNRLNLIIGLVGIALDIVIFYSPQFEWILD